MWAVLGTDNKTVVGIIPPNVLEEDALQQSSSSIIIRITLENSPAYLWGTYKDGKFYPKKEGN